MGARVYGFGTSSVRPSSISTGASERAATARVARRVPATGSASAASTRAAMAPALSWANASASSTNRSDARMRSSNGA